MKQANFIRSRVISFEFNLIMLGLLLKNTYKYVVQRIKTNTKLGSSSCNICNLFQFLDPA